MNDKKMKQTNTSEVCHAFQANLPEMFDQEADMSKDPHLATCADCSALVRDLEYIASQAKLLLPLHDPSPAVWENIQSALSKSVGKGNGETEPA